MVRRRPSSLRWTRCVTAASALALAAAACVGPTFVVQQYGGPVRPVETVAVLRFNGDEPVQLLALDDEDVGVPVARDSRLHIEVLPGPHTLTVRHAEQPRRIVSLAMLARAGRVYRVTFDGAGEREATVVEVERGSDRIVAVAEEPPRGRVARQPPRPTPRDDADAGWSPNEVADAGSALDDPDAGVPSAAPDASAGADAR